MRLFSFKGRINRLDYARIVICSYVLAIPLELVAAVGAHNIDASFPMPGLRARVADIVLPAPLTWIAVLIGVLLAIGFLVLLLSIAVRRFHDCNISGWFVPLWLVVLLFLPDRDLGDPLPSLAGLIWIAVMITVPGTRGANSYGPDPQAVEEVTALG